MKKIYLLFLAMLLSFTSFGQVSSYSFSQSNGTFTSVVANGVLVPGSEATTSTTLDSSGWTVNIPFTFNFNGINYTSIYVNSNGGATFGSTTSTSATVISTSTAYSGAIAVMNRDLWGVFITSGETTSGSNVITNVGSFHGLEVGKLLNNVNGIPTGTTVTAFNTTAKTITMSNAATSSSTDAVVRYGTGKVFTRVEGTAPNRVFVIEWVGFNDFATTASVSNYMSFQLRLAETSNTVSIVYGDYFNVSTTDRTNQIGLRGATNADFNNRTGVVGNSWSNTAAGTSNAATVSRDNTNFPVSGLTFTWIPPVPCTGTPSGGTVSIPNQILCNNVTPVAISVMNPNVGFIFTYQWEESDDNGVADAWANAVGGTGATTLTYAPPSFAGTTNKYYRLKTICTASGQSNYSTVHTVLMATAPNSAASLTFSNVLSSGMTIGWTNTNGNRRLVKISPVNTFTTMVNGSGAAHTASTTFSGTGEQIVYDGTGTSVTVTGLACNTTYYVQVYEYFRCGSSAPYNYWYSAALQGTQSTGVFLQTAVSLPASNNFVGFTGANLATVFPGWSEAIGDGPLSGTTSAWTNSSLLPEATAKVNLLSNSKKDWIISPTVNVNAASRIKFKAAITDYNSGNVDPARMQGTDDMVEVMISTDVCGINWVSLYTFNAANTTTLTNVLTDYIVTIPPQYIGQNVRIGFKGSEGSINDTPDYDFHITAVVIENTPPPTVTIPSQVNNNCFGGNAGSATAVVTDGLPPFTYSWSPSGGTAATATGLVAGTYTVTVTDAANRTATANVTILDLTTPVEATLNPTNISCQGLNNGLVSVTPSGGTSPYTYLWNTGATTSSITDLSVGTYSVTITDANGCTKTESTTITEPAVLAIASSSHTDVTWYGGNDGSATVSATGGTSPYSYSWSNGATTATAIGLIAGNYTVTVTDANGCSVSESFTISQPIPLMVQSTSSTNVKCNGGADGTATIVAIGGNAPYTYLWSPSGGTNATATGLAAGAYSVLVTDSTGNTITESFTITEPGAIQATLSHSKDVSCNGGNNGTATLTVTGGTAPFTYTWSNGTTTTNATVSNLVAGNYTVQVTDANGCTATAPVSLTIGQPAALVLTNTIITNVSCYGLNDGSASVTASGGVAPYTYLWSNGQSGSSLNNLGKGTYVVTVTDANNCSQTQSFTVTEPAFVAAPTAGSQNFCVGQNATLADVVINGSNIKWYNAATGGMLLPATTALVSGTTYYASQTVGTCESTTRTAVQITVGQAPALTTTQLSVCSNTRVQNMIVDGLNYTQLRWYSSSTGTIQLPSSTLLATGTYYVSSFVGACESARQAIQVTVAATVPAPTASFQTVCSGSTLNDLVVVKDPSATLNWYSSMQSMIPLANTTVVAAGTYYVQQVLGNCESSRIAVQVQVINITIPTITSITTCEGTTIADLNTNGTNYVWYADNNTTASLPSSYVITSGSYYIANQNGVCISARKNIAVNVGARPASPTGQSTQLFNFSAKVSDLAMNEPDVKWFLSANDAVKLMNELSATTPLTDATTYYGVLVTPNNCGSLVPTAVKVTINLSNAELDLTQLKYYPNPVDSELNISYIEEIKKVEVFTITGQKVFGNDYKNNEVKVDLSRLSAGTYLVKIETAKASQFVKIVKK